MRKLAMEGESGAFGQTKLREPIRHPGVGEIDIVGFWIDDGEPEAIPESASGGRAV